MNQPVHAAGFVEIRVEVGHDALEAVADFLIRQGSGGVSYSDELPGTACVVGYFRPDAAPTALAEAKAWLQQLPTFGLDPGPARVEATFVADADWANAWREHYHVLRVGQRLVIKPTWEAFVAEAGDVVLELDPGMAFGTGNHPTTALCLEALDAAIIGGERVADIGTGSGILAIAAAKLGASSVEAIDVDAEAVEIAQVNAQLNGVACRVRMAVGDAAALVDSGRGPFDIVVMNIIADVICAAAPELRRLCHPHGLWILSGIIEGRESDVKDALRRNGLRVTGRRQAGEWVLLEARREDPVRAVREAPPTMG